MATVMARWVSEFDPEKRELIDDKNVPVFNSIQGDEIFFSKVRDVIDPKKN